MTHEKFKELLKELDGESMQTLIEKNARYSAPDDALHNFSSGAEIMGRTPAETCWGYLTKHLTALRDMVQRNDFSNRADFLEKCQDSINYIRFLWCLGNEANEERTSEGNCVSPTVEDEVYAYRCRGCGFMIKANSSPLEEILLDHLKINHYKVPALGYPAEDLIENWYEKIHYEKENKE